MATSVLTYKMHEILYFSPLGLIIYFNFKMLIFLILLPIVGVSIIFIQNSDVSAIFVRNDNMSTITTHNSNVPTIFVQDSNVVKNELTKRVALNASLASLFLCLIIFIFYDFSTNQFQFVREPFDSIYYHFYLGLDGLSIYFVLLTTIIIPIALLSNWWSIEKIGIYMIIILLLETLLLTVFIALDSLLFYIFFESILPPLFILIGLFGSKRRVKASFYLFLYTLWGSLFLLLSIISMSGVISTTDYDVLFKSNLLVVTQLFILFGIFIAFAVKTPTIFLNTWLLKAHVESPLAGSIILAAIVLKLSLYGIVRLILPILPKAYILCNNIIYGIGVITIFFASLSTIRTIDVKELIAYSSVSHAAVYLLAMFSNSLQGIEGGITLGLAHGFVSPGLFICAGGILYDRSHTRGIAYYRGMAQILPLFAIMFFILCLANCGAPLTLNFVGEFLSLYGVFERSPLFGLLASSSIIFSAAYTMYMFQKIAFGGSYSKMFTINIPDLTYREFTVLLVLVVPTVVFGIYPAPILDGMHYSASTLLYSFNSQTIYCDSGLSTQEFFGVNDLSELYLDTSFDLGTYCNIEFIPEIQDVGLLDLGFVLFASIATVPVLILIEYGFIHLTGRGQSSSTTNTNTNAQGGIRERDNPWRCCQDRFGSKKSLYTDLDYAAFNGYKCVGGHNVFPSRDTDRGTLCLECGKVFCRFRGCKCNQRGWEPKNPVNFKK